MRLLKRITLLLTAAVLAVCFVSGDLAKFNAFAESRSAEYSPADSSKYKRWTGTTELKENHSYYIDSDVKISQGKRFTLPSDCTLLVKNGGSLTIYADSALTLKGELIIEPSARVVVSGELIALKDSRAENYGTFSATKSSVLELSSVFITGSKGITAFSGTVNVYKSGTLVNYNRLTFSGDSSATVSGKLVCEQSGVMFLKDEFSLTMNGSMISNGELYLYCHAAVAGAVTLGPGSRFYTSGGAQLKFTKSGRLTDNRKKDASYKDPEIKIDGTAPMEYDAEPENVHWIGIDVSRYQGAIDWERVKASGVDFVLLRSSIGDGTTTVSGEDIRFAVNVTEAKRAGLMVGAYHYLWAETVADARKEAKFFIKTISPYTLDFPAVLDFEEPSQQDNLTNAERTAIAKVFLEEVENAGYYPMLYTNKNWAENYLDMEKLSKYEVWLAEWHPKPSYRGDFGIWQYTAYGYVSGIAGDVDLDVCYKNYRKLILDGGYNHLK